ncbi:MAG TPA: SRPBCC domain-containing protein [Deinococcales bacterium]|nr:SRPBCC domain-containing protein [Deinococcales bacterium]
MTPTDRPNSILRIFIRATPEAVWDALTNGAVTPSYYRGMRVESDWQAGSAYRYLGPNGQAVLEGEVLEAEAPRRLRTTFVPNFAPGMSPLVLAYELEPLGAVTKLTMTYEGLDDRTRLGQGLVDGGAQILSGLKTWLETGEPLNIPFH